MISSSALLFTPSLLYLSLASAAIAPASCPPSEISVRIPPYLESGNNGSKLSPSNDGSTSYLAPPLDFYAGPWYLTNTSRAEYRIHSNLQWDTWPVQPTCVQNNTAHCPPGTIAGVLSDLSSWVLNDTSGNSSSERFYFGARGGGNRRVASTFAYDTPARLYNPELGADWDGVWINNGTQGLLAGYSEFWTVLYWGLDAEDVPFMVIHENTSTGAGVVNPPCVDAMSKKPTGPDASSLTAVLKKLEELNNTNLTSLVQDLGPVEWNYDLEGGPVICDAKCQQNGAK